MNLNTLLDLAIMIFAGMFCGRMAKHVHLPNVTGYLVAGLLIGPSVFGLLSEDFLTTINIISDVALGFIAFSIGNEFRLSALKHTGKQATVIAIIQALSAALLVDVVLLLLHLVLGEKLPVSTCIVLGAVATATAPAATIMVINQYKAKGPLTSLLLPIVALDDAVGLVVFAISFGVAKTMISGSFSLLSVILNPLLEIVCSLGLGVLVGGLFSLVAKLFHSNSKRLSVAVTFVILSTALSKVQIPLGGEIVIGFSPLLVCMMVGTVFCNVCDFSEEIMFKTDRWTAPLYILFFVLSGAELDLNILSDPLVLLIGVVYIAFRSLGKISGAFVSGRATHCSHNIQKYLGITLLPQAGVALGMAATAAELSDGHMVRNVVLFSVLVYELVGPTLTKISLVAAGEIRPEGRTSARVENQPEAPVELS